MKRLFCLLNSVLLIIILILPVASFSQRVPGAIVFYTFETVEGDNIIKDVSGVDPIIDLEMTEGVTKLADRNGVVITDADKFYDQGLFSIVAPAGLTTAIQATNALTVEFWGLPIDTLHDDARLVSYSFDGGHRNFSLMLEYNEIETRIRTAISGVNGYNPNWIAGSPQSSATPTAPFHVVWTYDAGTEYVYFNGELMGEFTDRGDDISSWDNTYKLIIGVEDNNDATRRQYEGEVYMVAMYDKALSEEEVKSNFDAGSVPSQTSITDVVSDPSVFKLEQNYPNPFNPETTIPFAVQHESAVSLKVYNTAGKEITTLVDSEVQQGTYDIQWNGTDSFGNMVPSGLYLYKLEAEGIVKSNKMLLVK